MHSGVWGGGGGTAFTPPLSAICCYDDREWRRFRTTPCSQNHRAHVAVASVRAAVPPPSGRLKVCHWVKVSQARTRGGGAGDGTARQKNIQYRELVRSAGVPLWRGRSNAAAWESEWILQRSDETLCAVHMKHWIVLTWINCGFYVKLTRKYSCRVKYINLPRFFERGKSLNMESPKQGKRLYMKTRRLMTFIMYET